MALFSATIPDWIETLQEKFLKNPVKVAISAATGTQSSIEQIAYRVPQEQKIAALCTLLHSTEGECSLIFGRTKYGVEKLGKQLSKLGFTVGTLHGNKSQRAREEVLTAFRRGQVQTLLATNVAARGLDITGISITSYRNRAIFLRTGLAVQAEWGDEARRLRCWSHQMFPNGGGWRTI